MKNDASYLFVAHNHPMGVCEPSAADILSTRKIKNALDLIGIKMVDHIILGRDNVYSIRQQFKENIFDDLDKYHCPKQKI